MPENNENGRLVRFFWFITVRWLGSCINTQKWCGRMQIPSQRQKAFRKWYPKFTCGRSEWVCSNQWCPMSSECYGLEVGRFVGLVAARQQFLGKTMSFPRGGTRRGFWWDLPNSLEGWDMSRLSINLHLVNGKDRRSAWLGASNLINFMPRLNNLRLWKTKCVCCPGWYLWTNDESQMHPFVLHAWVTFETCVESQTSPRLHRACHFPHWCQRGSYCPRRVQSSTINHVNLVGCGKCRIVQVLTYE